MAAAVARDTGVRTAPLLELRQVTRRFGGLTALNGVALQVFDREIVGLIGPNGAGKTTLFNAITGVHRPDSGEILIRGERVDRMAPYLIARKGVRRTYQIVRPFADMTVLENLMVGALFGEDGGVSAAERRAREVAAFMGLTGWEGDSARNLNLGEKKRLEVGRALAAGPALLLLDEALAGLTPREVDAAAVLIGRIRTELGVTIIIVEHVMRAIMAISDRIVVLHHGEKIADGTPREIRADRRVVEAYLGEAV
jgi:branched-chain amino acid transport system ATP-binding protein